jgi:hypothetical protein
MTLRARIAILALLLLGGLPVTADRPAGAQAVGLVRAVHAVGMTVADMDRSIAFYGQVLGFEKISDVEAGGALTSGSRACSGSGSASCGCGWERRRSS